MRCLQKVNHLRQSVATINSNLDKQYVLISGSEVSVGYLDGDIVYRKIYKGRNVSITANTNIDSGTFAAGITPISFAGSIKTSSGAVYTNFEYDESYHFYPYISNSAVQIMVSGATVISYTLFLYYTKNT